MDLTWIGVVDTAVKIGLGAAISALSGYFVLVKKQSHEDEQDRRKYFLTLQEQKKTIYVDFLSCSQQLTQAYLYTTCSPASEDIKQYLRTFNELQIISGDMVRVKAYDVMYAVQSFICLNKEGVDIDLRKNMLADTREKVSVFQKVAQSEVANLYEKI